MKSSAEAVTNLLAGERICIVDVGAADGLAKRWGSIAGCLHVVAFEPDSRSDATHDSAIGAEVTVVPQAASSEKGVGTIYLTRKPRCSSLYEPNMDIVNRYPDSERYDVLQTSQVDCTTIDIVMQEMSIDMDFLKIDTQGAELDCLRGAQESLHNCLGIEVEVEFQQLYTGASVFRDIDAYIARYEFELFDLRRTFFPRLVLEGIDQVKGQIIFGDALYFRHWPSLGKSDQLLKLATLMLTYGYADVVLEIIKNSQVLGHRDRQLLLELTQHLTPVSAGGADRKDRFMGSGLQLR